MKPTKKRKPREPKDLATLSNDGSWYIFVRSNLVDAETAEYLGEWLIKAAAWLRANEKEKNK